MWTSINSTYVCIMCTACEWVKAMHFGVQLGRVTWCKILAEKPDEEEKKVTVCKSDGGLSAWMGENGRYM